MVTDMHHVLEAGHLPLPVQWVVDPVQSRPINSSPLPCEISAIRIKLQKQICVPPISNQLLELRRYLPGVLVRELLVLLPGDGIPVSYQGCLGVSADQANQGLSLPLVLA